jgi:hypothetical protein
MGENWTETTMALSPEARWVMVGLEEAAEQDRPVQERFGDIREAEGFDAADYLLCDETPYATVGVLDRFSRLPKEDQDAILEVMRARNRERLRS